MRIKNLRAKNWCIPSKAIQKYSAVPIQFQILSKKL